MSTVWGEFSAKGTVKCMVIITVSDTIRNIVRITDRFTVKGIVRNTTVLVWYSEKFKIIIAKGTVKCMVGITGKSTVVDMVVRITMKIALLLIIW